MDNGQRTTESRRHIPDLAGVVSGRASEWGCFPLGVAQGYGCAGLSGRRRGTAIEAAAFSDGLGGALKGVQGYGGVAGVEETLQRRAAGFHAADHGGLGEPFRLHRLTNLEGEDFFEGLGLAFHEEVFFGEEIVEGGSEVYVMY